MMGDIMLAAIACFAVLLVIVWRDRPRARRFMLTRKGKDSLFLLYTWEKTGWFSGIWCVKSSHRTLEEARSAIDRICNPAQITREYFDGNGDSVADR